MVPIPATTGELVFSEIRGLQPGPVGEVVAVPTARYFIVARTPGGHRCGTARLAVVWA
jgi:hypothetical protein